MRGPEMLRLLSFAILLAVSLAVQPSRDWQEVQLTHGRGWLYSPELQGYSRRPYGSPRPHPGSRPSPPASPRALEDYLLPTALQPLSYDVQLIPYIDTTPEKAFTFDGQVTIRVRARSGTSQVVLHAWDLTVAQIGVVRVRDGASLPVSDYEILTDDRQFFTISVGEALVAGEEYDVFVFYTGILNGDGFGYFRSAYTDENGDPAWLTATQFESTGARRAFPCMDEPGLKATFKLSMATEPGFGALFNMPVASQGDPVEGLPGWTWVHFQQTPLMSTYLIAFSTHKFNSIESADGFYRVWSRPAVTHTGAWAIDFSPRVIQAFSNFTGLGYSLPKLDQIGMIDFFSGAMENWGLVTYQEPYVLHDPLEDDSPDMQLTTAVIAHELAHQWFGDLVSPKWWSSLWLNEGFATYFEHWGTDAASGFTWQMEGQFVVDTMQSVMRSDVSTSRTVFAADVDSPDSIDSIFDSVTYSKGGCIVRFMLNFLGENNFRAGINEYLTSLAYGNAEQDDLFMHLSPHAPQLPSGVSFKQLMDTWTRQPGFPLVTVSRNYATRTATISQARYGGGGTEQWIIPVTVTNGENPDFMDVRARAWLQPGEGSQVIDQQAGVPDSQSWLMINLQATGYYRVMYDLSNWRLISDGMSAPGGADLVHELNRAQLMDDALVFAQAGMLDYATMLRTTHYLAQETRLAPWMVADRALPYVRDRVYQTLEGVTLFQGYMQERLTPVYGSVSGFDQQPTDQHGTVMTRYLVTRWACDTGLTECHTDGGAEFTAWTLEADPDTNNPIHLDLRAPAYCAGVYSSGQGALDFLQARYWASNILRAERRRITAAMGCSLDTALLQSVLQNSLNSSLIRPADAQSVLAAVYGHPEGVDLALDFLIANWRELDVIYGNVGFGFSGISSKLNTQDHLDKLEQFKADNSGEYGQLTATQVNQAINSLQSHMAWNTVNLDICMDYFRQAA